MILLTEATPLLLALSSAFTQPTFQRLVTLLSAALLTTGRRTVANLLRTLRLLARGHRTSSQRVFSSARWSSLQLACALTRFLLTLLPAGPIILVGDDPVVGHKGKKVYGKARHRDAVRSSHSYTAWRYGHKWVVLAILVRFPFARRAWALPVLVALYLPPELNRQRRRPHRTPAQLIRRLLRLMLWWFPDRSFVFVGDAGYGTHEVARFCHRHQPRLTLVSKFHPKANLYLPPPPYEGHGRPRIKGEALPKPHEAAAAAVKKRRRVAWYGGGTRHVETAHGTGQWYKSGAGRVPVLGVFVQDHDGTHRDEYFFSTHPTLGVATVIGLYTGRWNIETTFQEVRSCLGLETTRGWCQKTVERVTPCLFGLYTVVALLYQALPETTRAGAIRWPGKEGGTFGDALAAVRRWLWQEWVFPQAEGGKAIEKLPQELREIVFSALSPAW